jgi:predicted deacylase
MQATNREDYILARESGIFEITVDLGVKVKKGQIIG